MGCGASTNRRRGRLPQDGDRPPPLTSGERELHVLIDAQRHRAPSIAQSAEEPNEVLDSVRRTYHSVLAQIRDKGDFDTPAPSQLSSKAVERIDEWLEKVESATDHDFLPIPEPVLRRVNSSHSLQSHSETTASSRDGPPTEVFSDAGTELGDGQSVAASSRSSATPRMAVSSSGRSPRFSPWGSALAKQRRSGPESAERDDEVFRTLDLPNAVPPDDAPK